MPDPDASEDQAVRYLLGELAGQEKLDFEAQLAASPALRATLQELESACEALALTAPNRQPSRAAWKAIERETRQSLQSDSLASRANRLRSFWREWFGRAGWGVALAMILLWAFRHPSTSEPSTSQALNQAGLNADATSVPAPSRPNSLPSSRSASPGFLHVNAANPTGSTPSAGFAREDSHRLERAIRELNEINRTLTQQLVLPPGAGRFQVFRLSSTNNAQGSSQRLATDAALASREPTVAPPTDAASLEDLLARALAQELASTTRPPTLPESQFASAPNTAASTAPGTPGTSDATQLASATPNTEPGGSPSVATPTASDATVSTPASSTVSTSSTTASTSTTTSGFDVVDLNSGTQLAISDAAPSSPVASRTATPSAGEKSTLADPLLPGNTPASALGVYSLETGAGSIAFVTSDTLAPGYAYQFWAIDAQGNATINLGTTTNPNGKILVRFSLDPGIITSPGFMVTVEPEFGSPSPSGPVVVAPPGTANPGNPTPPAP